LVRRKGERCEVCGSTDLRCAAEFRPYLGGGVAVDLWCNNAEDERHVGKIGLVRFYSLTQAEARQIGYG
jgi:hypothetical protein